MRNPLLIAGLLISLASRLTAGDDTSTPAPAPIGTDRPAVTDSSIVVPQGSCSVSASRQPPSCVLPLPITTANRIGIGLWRPQPGSQATMDRH
jgi:hypothetical protein